MRRVEGILNGKWYTHKPIEQQKTHCILVRTSAQVDSQLSSPPFSSVQTIPSSRLHQQPHSHYRHPSPNPLHSPSPTHLQWNQVLHASHRTHFSFSATVGASLVWPALHAGHLSSCVCAHSSASCTPCPCESSSAVTPAGSGVFLDLPDRRRAGAIV